MMEEREGVEFLALTVHRGFLTREQGKFAFEQMQAGRPLDEVIVGSEWVSPAFWKWIRQTEAGKNPRLPGYAIRERIGVGGTAEVFLAEGEQERGLVALKILDMKHARDPVARKRFQRESRLLIELDHPNVVKGYRLARFEQVYFLAMEYVHGKTVLELLDGHAQFDEDTALYLVLQTARALEYLREQGVVHRDVKPGNIMVGEHERVKLIDLGFATKGGAEGGDDEGREGTTLGTAAYISPELARGSEEIDIRSDIYALGATLYQLVLGKLPFEGQTSEELLRRHVMDNLSSADLKGRRISPHLHYFIEKMMAKERDLRYQDPQDLIADIESQIQGKKTLEYSREEETGLDPKLLRGDDEEVSRAVRRVRLRRSKRHRGRK